MPSSHWVRLASERLRRDAELATRPRRYPRASRNSKFVDGLGLHSWGAIQRCFASARLPLSRARRFGHNPVDQFRIRWLLGVKLTLIVGGGDRNPSFHFVAALYLPCSIDSRQPFGMLRILV
jgi:hypothetical protein